jgi:hypothetical protein
MLGQSPHSSSGAVGSSEGTPDTRLTSFSPEDARPVKALNASRDANPSRANQNDPFITEAVKTKGEQKLSAMAMAFQPFAIPVASGYSSPAIAYGSGAVAALPGKIQALDNLIAQMKPIQAPASLPQSGDFSSDTVKTRCIMVTSTCNEDLLSLVSSKLEVSIYSTSRANAKISFDYHED